MSILSTLFSNYGDDLARQFANHADDAVLAGIRNYGDDTIRAAANQSDDLAKLAMTKRANVPLNQRLTGDSLLDAQDLIDNIKSVGGTVDDFGNVRLYHRTTPESAQKIMDSGKMFGKEDGLFFSTAKNGVNNSAYGSAPVAFDIPAENLMLDDLFADEASIRMPLQRAGQYADISDFISKPKTIYHGTNKVFDNFDESIPSTWFTDNADDIANTGLSNNGGKINIMERELPGDLKLADWDLADRLTKQQLIDRGYDGVAYTGSGTSGNDTYYEIFKPNQTLKKINKDQSALRSLTTDDEIIPLFRGQKYGTNDLLYNHKAGAGTSQSVGNAFYFTPNEKMTAPWADSGVIQIPARKSDFMTLDDLLARAKEADELFADPRAAQSLYNTNPTQYDLMEAIADRRYKDIAELTGKPFIQPDSGQGEELMETLFFPDVNPTLTDIYRELLRRSGGKPI